ncbi:hypothetical protein AKJ62_04175 [candidate division MSBL1 archaeon SCGC-AAA259D14]|uniref:Uncharacterized protein n=2 Tax=candidate division MSBL1 TaxID=215777 RepID=A0A133UTS4_9EURY|nr:hypothetical protein AKJ62_04175 [candidate division MSBL1 archaeon SCGC-AAA259D14]KXA97520.1 hypothetical protein AKJ38_00985 [candidate division MSBL1 archaeon SCGC-AAA259I14]
MYGFEKGVLEGAICTCIGVLMLVVGFGLYFFENSIVGMVDIGSGTVLTIMGVLWWRKGRGGG